MAMIAVQDYVRRFEPMLLEECACQLVHGEESASVSAPHMATVSSLSEVLLPPNRMSLLERHANVGRTAGHDRYLCTPAHLVIAPCRSIVMSDLYHASKESS